MPHLDDGRLQELVDGEIPSAALGDIQAHLLACVACAARLDAARDAATTADTMLTWLDASDEVGSPHAAGVAPAPPAERGSRRASQHRPRQLAWAASMVLAVGLGYAARGMPNFVPSPAPSAAPVPNRQAAAASDRAASDRAITATEPPPSGATASRSTIREPAAAAPPERQSPLSTERATEVDRRQIATSQQARAELDAVTAPTNSESNNDRTRETTQGVVAPAPAAAPADRLLAPRRSAALAAKAAPPMIRTADSLGTPVGMVFRIEGLELLRTVLSGEDMRLIYAHPDGEVTLVQRRVGDQVAWHLEVPTGFPASVLRELKEQVK